MFCGQCGTKFDDGAAFCPNCGAKVGAAPVAAGTASPNAAASNVTAPNMPTAENAPVPNAAAPGAGAPAGPLGIPGNDKPAVKINPVYLLGGCIAVFVLLIIIIVIANRKTVVDLNKFVKEPVFEGYNGFGSAESGFLFDEEAFAAEYAGKIKYTGTSKTLTVGYDSPEAMLADYCNGYMDAGSKLSNGDAVTFKWTIDENLLKTYFKKCKLKYSDVTFTVSGLTPLREINPFDDITVTFEGIAPNGSCKIDVQSEEDSVNSLYISADKNYDLSNGDAVKVKVACYYSDDLEGVMAESYGVILTETEKTYTVEGLESYVSEYADIGEEYLTYAKSEAEDTIAAYTANNYDNTNLNDLAYAGYIFETAKDTDDYYGDYNILYLIYSGYLTSTNGSYDKTKVYYPVRFEDLLKGADGKVTGETTNDISGWSYIGGSWSGTDGYTNPLTCYNELVESYRDSYVAVVGDGFEDYSSDVAINGLDDLYESCRTVLSDMAKEKIENYINDSYDENIVVKNLKLDREYILLAKEPGTDYASNNKYYVVYSATVSHKDKNFEKTTVYYPVEFDGIVNFPNGDYLVTAGRDIQGSFYFENTWTYSKGYTDPEAMYKDIVTGNRTSYTSDVTKK